MPPGDETSDLEGQISLNQALNDVLSQRAGILSDQNAALGEQSNLAAGLESMLGNIGSASDDASTGMGDLNAALAGLTKGAGGASGGMASFMSSMIDSKGATLGLGVAMAKLGFDAVTEKAVAAGEAIMAAFTGGLSTILNIAGALGGTITGGLGLISKAAEQARARGVQLAEAWEDVKKSISTVGPNMDVARGAVENMGMAGASTAQLFGKGPDGMANAIRYVGEVAGELGPTLTKLGSDFSENIDTYVIANKALGISGEGMKSMYLMAAHAGEELSTVLDTQARMTVGLSKQFGIDAKHIGKNLDAMAQDYATFGSLSQTELAATAAYAAKLGVGMKALQGITGKTDDFESAAQAASELAGTFGMNVDTMELMTADPAEKLQMMRDAFSETGQSFEDMSRQEKQRMSDLTGMDVSDLASALDPSNAEVNFADMEAGAAAAADGAITQEEANMALAKSIDKITDKLEHLSGINGPLSGFMKGITDGIMNSPEFLEILNLFNESLQIIYKAGKKVGAMLGTALGPDGGLSFIGDFLKDVFDPTRISGIMDSVVGSFQKFFDALKDPEKAVTAFGDLIADLFDNVFGGGNLESGGAKFADFFVKVFDFALGSLIGAIPTLLTKGVEFITQFFESMSASMSGETDSAGDEMGTTMFPMISTAIDSLIESLGQIDWGRLASSIIDFVITAFKEEPEIFTGILLFFFGGPVISAAFALIKTGALAAMQKGISGLMKKGPGMIKSASKGLKKGLGAIGKKLGPKISGNFSKAASFLGRAAGPLAIIAAVGAIGMSISDLQEKQGKEMEEKFGEGAASAGILGASVIDAITLGLLPDSLIGDIANFFANITKTVTDAMEALGLGSFVDAFNDQMVFITDVLGGFGDILSGIFAGDSDLVSKGFKKMFSASMEFFKELPGNVLSMASDIIVAFGKILGEVAVWIFTDGLKLLINAVTKLVTSLGGALWDLMMGIWSFFTDEEFRSNIMTQAAEFAMGLITGVTEPLMALPGRLWEIMTDVWSRIAEYWGFASPSTKMIELGTGLLDGVLSGLGAITQGFLDLVTAAWDGVKGFFSWDTIVALGTGILDGIKAGFDIGGMMLQAAKDAWASVTAWFSGSPIDAPTSAGGELGKGVSGGVAAGLANMGPDMMGEAVKALVMLAEVMSAGAVEVGMVFVKAFSEVAASIIDVFAGIAQQITGVFMGLGDAVVTQLTAVLNVLNTAFSVMADMFQRIREVIVGNLSGVFDVFFGIFSGIADVVTHSMVDIFHAVKFGVTSLFQIFTTAKDFITGTVKDIAFTMVDVFKFAMTTVIDIIASGINSSIKVLRKATRLVGDVISVMSGMAKFGTIFSVLGDGLKLFGPNPERVTKDLAGFEITFMQLNRTQIALARLEKTLDGRKDVEVTIAERIATVVDAYNQGAIALSNLNPINIDAVLEMVNESLRVRRDKITIEDNGITINMSLNVTMKAEDVAIPMIEADLVTKGSSTKVNGIV